MLQQRGTAGIALGVAALVLGVASFAGVPGAGVLALLAGLCGLGAGTLALHMQIQADPGAEALIAEADQRALAAADRTAQAQREAENERRLRGKAEDEVATLTATLDAKKAADLSQRATVPAGDSAAHSEGARVLTDPLTNLFSEAYFRVALDARIASARRHLRPVAIALLDVVEGVSSDSVSRPDPVEVTRCIRQTLRDADTACRLTDGVFALILEDTPENGAVWTVERIRRTLTNQFPDVTLWAGVACYPAHAFSTEELLDASRFALTAARDWRQDRIEVATAD